MNQRTSYIVNLIYIFNLILLLTNDFYFKSASPNIVTGKLSDFSGLVVFYGFISFLFGLNQKLTWGVALLFVYWKSGYSQPCIDLFNEIVPLKLSRVVDYTDLSALMVLPIYHRYLQVCEKWKCSNALIPLVIPVAVFSISATSAINPLIAERYDKYVSRYNYSDSEIIYKVNLPLKLLNNRFKASNYYVSESYYIQPWDGKVYSFSPLDRCTRHAVFQEKGIENINFDAAQVQLKDLGQETEVRLYSLTLCHDQQPLEKTQAISVFEEKFFVGLEFNTAK